MADVRRTEMGEGTAAWTATPWVRWIVGIVLVLLVLWVLFLIF